MAYCRWLEVSAQLWAAVNMPGTCSSLALNGGYLGFQGPQHFSGLGFVSNYSALSAWPSEVLLGVQRR